MELAKEVRDAGVRLGQSLEHHFGLGASMLGQQDFAEPSFAHDLQDIELVDQVHLFDRGKRKDSAVLTRLNEWRILRRARCNNCSFI